MPVTEFFLRDRGSRVRVRWGRGNVLFRLGEEFELLSDPFPEADQIAIRAKTISESSIRILRLPVTIVQTGRRQQFTAA